MSIIVQHEKRRAEILAKALDVFVEEGYHGANYAKIAERCDITRTTLYTYFHNKLEIFQFSVKQLLTEIEADIKPIERNPDLSASERLERCMFLIIGHFERNRRLLLVLLDYFLHASREGIDPDVRVRKQTLRLRHILSSIIIDGCQSGEFAKISVKSANNIFYGFLEQAALRLTVFRREKAGLEDSIKFAVLGIRSRRSKAAITSATDAAAEVGANGA
jgi:AcrR family transcriptional regulator